MNWMKVCEQVCELAREVGGFIRSESGKVQALEIETKYKNNFVSYVDKKAEALIVEGLKTIIPDAGFIVEEGTVEETKAEWQWIVDPLDGTTNFLHQLPSYAVSIALRGGDETVLGVVYEINKKECFSAYKGGIARVNEQQIFVSKTSELKGSLISTGMPYYDFEILDEYMCFLKHLVKNSGGIRRYGAAAVDLCYVACGRYDAFFEHSLSPWDVAAGAFIVQMAGGHVSDFQGDQDYIFGRRILATNELIYNEFLGLSRQYLCTSIRKTEL